MKLVVEVVGAHDLPARRSRGGVAPFAQVTFGGQRHATRVRPGEVNPAWNETLVFVLDATGRGRGHGRLSDGAIDVGVYHRRASGGKSCLGRLRLFGAAVAPSAEEAVLLRCPLDKPSFFAGARGEVALRLYMAPYASSAAAAAATNAPAGNAYSSTYATTLFSDTASMAGPETVVGGASTQSSPAIRMARPETVAGGASTQSAPAMRKNREKKEPPVQVFHSIPAQSGTGSRIFPPPPPPRQPMPPPPPPPSMPQPAGVPKVTKKAAPATGDDAKAAEYLMVDRLEFLYVNVVCARDLPGMDLTLGVDPYVEVRVGNYSAVTRHLVRNHYPEWNQVFAFSKDHLQADNLEVIVKDRNLVARDSFVGKVVLTINEVPSLAPPNRPLAPQWYGLKCAKQDRWTGGEIMLAAWKGSQADEAFAGALHADVHDLPPSAVVATQTKTYYSPRLCYLRCHVIAAQDLVHPDRSRRSSPPPNVFVRVQLGAQRWDTRPSPSAKWDQDFFLVAAWPFEEPLVVTVMDAASPERHEVLGRLVLPKGSIKVQQFDKRKFKPPPPSWFDLERPRAAGNGDGDGDGRDREWRHGFRSKIQLRVYYDAAYHVLDELTTYGSDFEPSARVLRKQPVGVLELAVLRATGLPAPKRPANGGGRGAVDAYCVAKYGQKWIRTRTLVGTASPSWQEQFTFDVFDPCTVLTVAVFDNNQLAGAGESSRRGPTDTPLGKVRIRVSTLTSGRTYEHPYSLYVVRPAGVLRCGELHLAVRFTHTAWVGMMSLYLRPTLPSQHFARPVPAHLAEALRRHAADAVAARLARAEPPLRPEAVHYLLRDPAAHPSPSVPEYKAYSMRRSLAACARLRDVLAPVEAFLRWFAGVRDWTHPPTTVLVQLLFLLLTWRPELILPTVFLYLFASGAWNYRWRPARPAQMEHYCDGVPQGMLGEEFDAGPASGTPPETVEWWYRRLRETATNVQVFIGNAAAQGERVHALLAWRDGRATTVALVAAAALAFVTYAVPFKAVVAAVGLYVMRHPVLRRRRKEPSALMSFFRRLPSNADVIL